MPTSYRPVMAALNIDVAAKSVVPLLVFLVGALALGVVALIVLGRREKEEEAEIATEFQNLRSQVVRINTSLEEVRADVDELERDSPTGPDSRTAQSRSGAIERHDNE